MLLPVDKMCNIDVKDAYSITALSVELKNYVRFQWKGLRYEFCFLCFGFSPAPLVFTKLSKVPISLLRKLSVRILIYLGDMLLMSSSLWDLLMAKRYTDIHISTLRVSDQFQKVLPRGNIDFKIYLGNSRF